MKSTIVAQQKNDASFDTVWDELVWRGLIHVSTDEAALKQALAETELSYYCGFDPTAPSLHLGNLVQLLLMRRLQLAGHNPVGLVGGATGLIGDPRPTAERNLNDLETVAKWVELLKAQVERFLDFEGEHPAQIANNLDWTSKLSAIEFLRDIGQHFRIGTMIKKDAVSARLNSEAGISYTEFSYQVLQGMDFLELYRTRGVTLQTGGSDQWGNLISGIDLIRRTEPDAKVHAIGTPLITNSDGTKFGKSEGNAIWLDAELCSPYAFYQFWLNTDDRDVITRLKVFTFLSRVEIEALEQSVATEPHLRLAQKTLAQVVTDLVHGPDATLAQIAASAALFGQGDLSALDAQTLSAATAELPSTNTVLGTSIVQLLQETGLTKSLGEGRRAIDQGGVYVNNLKVGSADRVLEDSDILSGGHIILRRGKKTLAAARIPQ
ncbi:MAG: tyrosine--tRNA ligase [Microbacteriaceae bacterium]